MHFCFGFIFRNSGLADWDKATLMDRARQIIRETAENSTHKSYTRTAVNGHSDKLSR